MALVLPLGLLYEAQKIINGEYHDLIIVKEEEDGPIDIIVSHAGVSHHHDSEAHSGAHWWGQGDKNDAEFKVQTTEKDIMDLLDPEELGEIDLEGILDTLFRAIYFDRMVDQLKIRKVDREAERLKIQKYKEEAMRVQKARDAKDEKKAAERHAAFEKRKADKQREKDEARKYLLERVKYARALLKAEAMRIAAIKHAREIEERKRQAPHLNLPKGKLYEGEETINGVKGVMNIAKDEDGHVHLVFKDPKTNKQLFDLERTDDELITALGYSVDKLKEMDMKELLHLFSKLPQQFDKKTGNVKLHKLTDDEVKAAKEAVKEEILMESKPLLHDEIESGGKLYMVHLFHKNNKIRISAYEEINGGKEEGFHMEKSMTYAEVFKLSNIDKEKFASLFSYYNAILKSFKVILGKKKVLGKRQREITLKKYIPQKKRRQSEDAAKAGSAGPSGTTSRNSGVSGASGVSSRSSTISGTSRNSGATGTTGNLGTTRNLGNSTASGTTGTTGTLGSKNSTGRSAPKAYNLNNRPKIVEKKFKEKQMKIAGRDYIIKFRLEDEQIYLECLHTKSKKMSKMKTSVARLLQKLPVDKQFSDSEDESFDNCTSLLKIKKGYGSSGGMILELANYNEMQKKMKRRRKRSVSNISSVLSSDTKPVEKKTASPIAKGKMSIMEREKMMMQKKQSKRRSLGRYEKAQREIINNNNIKYEKAEREIINNKTSSRRRRKFSPRDDKPPPPVETGEDFESLSIIPLHMLQSGIMKMPSAVSGVIGRNGEISVSNTSIVYDRDDVDIDRTCITTIDDELPTGKEFVSVLEKRLKTQQGDEFELAIRVDKWGSPGLKTKSKKPGYQAFIKTTPTLVAKSLSPKSTRRLSPLRGGKNPKSRITLKGTRMSSVKLTTSIVDRSLLGYDRD